MGVALKRQKKRKKEKSMLLTEIVWFLLLKATEYWTSLKSLVFFFFFFLVWGAHPQHIEVPRLGLESELQLPLYPTATATWDLSRVFDLHHSSLQCQILNPLSKAWDQTFASICLPCLLITPNSLTWEQSPYSKGPSTDWSSLGPLFRARRIHDLDAAAVASPSQQM